MPNMNNIEYDRAPEDALKFTSGRTGLFDRKEYRDE